MGSRVFTVAAMLASACLMSACMPHDRYYYDHPYDVRVREPFPPAVAHDPRPPREIRPYSMRPLPPPPPPPQRQAMRQRPGVYYPPLPRSRDKDVIERREDGRIFLDVPSDILFALDSYALRPRARAVIAEIAERLRRDGRLDVEVHGFTDTSGTREHNQRLSEGRANAVAQELERHGVDPQRIQARGFGESNLLVRTRDGVREPKNRRVEIVLDPRGPNGPPRPDYRAPRKGGYRPPRY